MNTYKNRFDGLTREYLLELRARGDGLVDEAHLAIEEIFKERGEVCPARPKTAIPKPSNPNEKRSARNAKTFAIMTLALISWVTAKALAHTWIGVLITALAAGYWGVTKLRDSTKSPDEKEREKQEEKASNDYLTELMTCAAEGNVARMKELIEYGHDTNQRSLGGSTALIYAARNNQSDAIKLLLDNGADPRLANDKKQTAESVARTFGNIEALNVLKQA